METGRLISGAVLLAFAVLARVLETYEKLDGLMRMLRAHGAGIVADFLTSTVALAVLAVVGVGLIWDSWRKANKSNPVPQSISSVKQNQNDGSGIQVGGDVHGDIHIGRTEPPPQPIAEESRKYFARLSVVAWEKDVFSIVYDKQNTALPERYMADCAMYLVLTNVMDTPRMVDRISFEARTPNDEWVTLRRLPISSSDRPLVYFGDLLLPYDKNAFLEILLTDHPLQPHQPVSGWVFFQSPLYYSEMVLRPYRIVIADLSGDEYVSPPLTAEGESLQFGQLYMGERRTSVKLFPKARWRQ